VGNSGGSHIVSFDPVEHREIPDIAFDQLDHIPSDRVPQGLARVVACDPGELRGYTTGTLVTGLCHTVVSLGDYRPATWRGYSNSWVGVIPARFSFVRSAWPPVGPTAVSSTSATATSTTRNRRRSAPVVHPAPGGVGLCRPIFDRGG